jgi:hypothetical protein
VTVPPVLAGLASGFTVPPLLGLLLLALTPPAVVTPPATTTVPPVEVVAPVVVVPPEAGAPPVAGVPPELATLESGRLTVPSVFEQFPMATATRNRPETCRTRKQRGRVADGVIKLGFVMDRVLLRNQ